jgi:hypothetical protein
LLQDFTAQGIESWDYDDVALLVGMNASDQTQEGVDVTVAIVLVVLPPHGRGDQVRRPSVGRGPSEARISCGSYRPLVGGL